MRTWRKTLGLLAGGLAYLGGMLSAAHGQFGPPPGGGGYGMPPGGMGMPPGGGVGMPPGGAFAGNPALMGRPADFPNPGQPSQEPVSPFSLKDDGAPNAFTDLIDSRLCQPLCWQFAGDYVMFWFQPGSYPPLATTGLINNPIPGAIGQPGTTILSHPFEPGMASAARVRATFWLKDPEVLSLDASFFIMEQRSVFQTYASNANGQPLLARPYFNPVARQEDADLRSAPGILLGTMSDSVTTRLMGADSNLRWHSSTNYEGSRFAFLTGVRWLRLDERYQSYDTSADVRGVALSSTYTDTFTTYNQFFGGQVGLEWLYKMSRFTFGLGGKVAFGRNYQTIKISGQTVVTNLTTGGIGADDFGLYSQPSNVGNYRSGKNSILADGEAKIGIDITERCRFNVGYTFLWLNNSVRPGDQMDRVINIQPLQTGGGTPPFVPGPPTFHQSSFTGHLLNVGIEFLY